MNAGHAAQTSVDWPQLSQTLQHFAAATGMCVSAYDGRLQRRAGPFLTRRVAGFMQRCGTFDDTGTATATERSLVGAVTAGGPPAPDAVEGLLQVAARPVSSSHPQDGVIVFGWVFGSFPTSLGCARLARLLHLDAGRLWAEARLEAPVAERNFDVAARLLDTLMESIERQAQALQRLHELAAIRQSFLARVSHELRTPLSAMMFRTEIMLRSALDDPARLRRELESLKRYVAEESRLIEDLIDAARTETGQLSIERRPVGLDVVIMKAAELVRPAAEAKGVALEVPPATSLGPARVLADAARLQQVLWNLMANGIKFTPAGGQVRVTVHPTGDSVNVAVADNGAGIEAALLPLVFEPFTKKTAGNADGLGLGLAIARSIVEQHGGTITVRSDGPGQGATFHVVLPRLVDDDAKASSLPSAPT